MEEVIGFFGGDSQTGTTMITWSFAERLSDCGKKVLLLLGSGNEDRFYDAEETDHSIDNLKAMIRSGRVEKDDLFQYIERRKNLWILPGTKNSLSVEYFPGNTFQILLENIKDVFDFVVIDGGSNLRLGLTISALDVSDTRFFVVTQQAKTMHRYIRNQERLLQPLGMMGKVIINQYRKDPALFLKKDMCRRLGTDDIMVIPYVEEGWQMEMEQKNLLGNLYFCRAIDCLVNPFVGEEKKVFGWRRFFA